MKKNSSIKAALVPCILAAVFVSLSCVHATAEAQKAKPAYTPPPDQMIYIRVGPKDRSVSVTATNLNVPGLPSNLTYFKDTDETLDNIGYDVADNRARAAIKIRVTAKYTEVDPGQAVGNAVARGANGAILGVLGGPPGVVLGALRGIAPGGGGQGATPTGLRYLTLEFEISSKRGGTQTGQVTKDISDPTIRLEEFIDNTIGAYIEAALPNKS